MQTDLFSAPAGTASKVDLPGGELDLYRGWLPQAEANDCFSHLYSSLDWQQPLIVIGGEKKQIPRLQAWHGDEYSVAEYSGTRFEPAPWNRKLISLKDLIEIKTNTKYNSVLVNLYRNGADSVSWHADDEKELGGAPIIASLSLGATRPFALKPKAGGKTLRLELSHGDLLVMKGSTQRNWLHTIPKTTQVIGPRINLTFRYIFS